MPSQARIYSSRDNVSIETVAMHPNGRVVYLGGGLSFERNRLNLGVLTLNSSGIPDGDPVWFPDSEQPLPIGHWSAVHAIRLHRSLEKLYLLSYIRFDYGTFAQPFGEVRLVVYDVKSGELVGSP